MTNLVEELVNGLISDIDELIGEPLTIKSYTYALDAIVAKYGPPVMMAALLKLCAERRRDSGT